MLSGGCIVQRIDENLTYDYLHSSEDNLWSILYLTGYLTRARNCDFAGEVPEGTTALMIPNEEIREIFETTIIRWFDDSARTWNRTSLFDAVWSGDSEGVTKAMNALLRRTISYHDYREDFYHAFQAGIFTGAGYMVDSNKEHGEGRSDVVVYDPVNGRVAIFEAKYTKILEKLEPECDEALAQIDDRMYAKEYEEDYDQILCYGISFFKNMDKKGRAMCNTESYQYVCMALSAGLCRVIHRASVLFFVPVLSDDCRKGMIRWDRGSPLFL